jgi:Uncharacterized conserved protein
MDVGAAERFRVLVAAIESEPPLDEGALLIAATANGSDVDAGLARLDDFAGAALAFPEARTAGGLARVLFVEWGFAGNINDYGDPRNSFLPEVMDRRLGLPITLSVFMIEVGRRIGVGLHGVGMPGHFLVGVGEGAGQTAEEFVDPFNSGAVVDRERCRMRFVAQFGPQAQFDAAMLRPTPSRLILLRMLTNLQQTCAARRSPDARWAANLRLAFPELPAEERQRTAEVLASVGAFDDAAIVLDGLAAAAPAETSDGLARQAVAYRARSN